jgi:hypothetical protein
MARRRRDTPRLKILMAQESARIMVEEGVQDFRSAKRKAAIRLAVTDKAALPDNAEIEQALLDYQRLFHADRQALRLRGLRETALEVMLFLARFRPRLVGPVLSGTAGPHADIGLHLFADTPMDVLLFLMEHRIPFDTTEHRLKLGNGDPVCLPAFRLRRRRQPYRPDRFRAVGRTGGAAQPNRWPPDAAGEPSRGSGPAGRRPAADTTRRTRALTSIRRPG